MAHLLHFTENKLTRREGLKKCDVPGENWYNAIGIPTRSCTNFPLERHICRIFNNNSILETKLTIYSNKEK